MAVVVNLVQVLRQLIKNRCTEVNLELSQAQIPEFLIQFYLLAHIFNGKTTRCNDSAANFKSNTDRNVRYALLVLRRELSAESAGVFTGTPTYKIKDIYVYF